jgi:anthranilate phosphoribosyltransferase
VLLNAAAALLVADAAPDLKTGVEMARVSLDSGAARAKLTRVAQVSQEKV